MKLYKRSHALRSWQAAQLTRQLGEYEYDWHDYYKKKTMPSRRVFNTTFAVEGI